MQLETLPSYVALVLQSLSGSSVRSVCFFSLRFKISVDNHFCFIFNFQWQNASSSVLAGA